MYRHIKENWPGYADSPDAAAGPTQGKAPEHEATLCPSFETWQRYVREYERLTTGPKNTPRGGRETGHSVVKRSEI